MCDFDPKNDLLLFVIDDKLLLYVHRLNRLYGKLARRDCETDRKRYVVDQAHLLSQGINITNKHSLSDKQTSLLFLSLFFQVERIRFLYILLA